MDPVTVTAQIDLALQNKLDEAADALDDVTSEDFSAAAELLRDIVSQLRAAQALPLTKTYDDDGTPAVEKAGFADLLDDVRDDVLAYELLTPLLTDGSVTYEYLTYTVTDRAKLIDQVRDHMAGANRGDESAEMAGLALTLLDTES